MTELLLTNASLALHASPELILDRSRDYILYVVDPEETYKASQRTSTSSSRLASQQHSSSRPGPSSSAQSSKDDHSSDIFVGRGFFGWILQEEGDGDTVVVGKITREGHNHDQYSDEEDESNEYLDVEIRLRETQAQSRDQYFAMLRQLGGGAKDAAAASSLDMANESNSPSPEQARKRTTEKAPIAATSPVRPRGEESTGNAAFGRPSNAPMPLRQPMGSLSSPLRPSLPMTTLGQANATSTQNQSQTQTLQLLQLLHALQAQQQQHQQVEAPATAAATSTQPLLQVGNSQLQRSISQPQISHNQATTDGNPFSQPSGGLQRSTTMSNLPHQSSQAKLEQSGKQQPESTTTAGRNSEQSLLTCYNCGKTGDLKSTWRLVVLSEGEKVKHLHGFECHHYKAKTDDVEEQDLTPGAEGWVKANGISTWRACNSCGLYWIKWKTSRPEGLGQQNRRRTKPARTREGADGDSTQGEQDELESSSPVNGRSEKKGWKYHMSEIIEDQHGNWRSRRSIKNNPDGKRAGRPKIKDDRGKPLASSNDKRGRRASTQGGSPSGDESIAISRPPQVAQSSPVRPHAERNFPWETIGSKHTQPSQPGPSNWHAPRTTIHAQSTPGITPSRRRYAAPSYLLNSSPATALDALLSEGDFHLGYNDPSKMLPGSHGVEGSPRRSPRKNPTGTRDNRNPYASGGSPKAKGFNVASPSAGLSLTELTKGAATPSFDMDLFNTFTTFKSPTSSANSRAGQLMIGSSPQSQDDGDDEDEGEERDTTPTRELGSSGFTAVTSPASPSPTQNRFVANKTRQMQAAKASSSSMLLGSSPLTRSQVAVAALDDADDEDDVHDSPSTARKGRMNSSAACPASPSLGQKRKREAAASGSNKRQTATTPREAHVLTKGPSPSPARSLGRRTPQKQTDIFGDTRNIVPTPRHNRSLADFDTARASLSPTQRKLLEVTLATKSPLKNSTGPLTVAHRKPLPATVEDASSSAASSPDGEDLSVFSPYDHATVESFLDMFEDPYGLLEANGIGLPGMSASGGVVNGSNANGTGSLSVDLFAGGVQLHDRLEFHQHLQNFTEQGSRGTAAFALPGADWSTQTTDQRSDKKVEPSPAAAATAGTPIEAGKENRPSTPKKSERASNAATRASPLTPSKQTALGLPVRASPRLAKISEDDKGKQAAVPFEPPRTPKTINSTSQDLAMAPWEPPRTPLTKNLTPGNALALASASAALARSPNLQRVLNQSPGGLDFAAIFGNHNSMGSPMFSTPRTSSRFNNSSWSNLPPMSPSLSRLLQSFSVPEPGVQSSQGLQEATSDTVNGSLGKAAQIGLPPTSSDSSAMALQPSDQDQLMSQNSSSCAVMPMNDGGLGDFPPEALAELHAMFQDPGFQALWESSNGGEAGFNEA